MSAYQPLSQLLGSFVGCLPIKRHQGGRHPRRLHDAGAPTVGIDRGDFKQVRTACDGFFETTDGCVHGKGLKVFCVGDGNEFYASHADDQAKRRTKAESAADRPQIAPEKESKIILLSGDSQEMHVASTGFPQLDARETGTYA